MMEGESFTAGLSSRCTFSITSGLTSPGVTSQLISMRCGCSGQFFRGRHSCADFAGYPETVFLIFLTSSKLHSFRKPCTLPGAEEKPGGHGGGNVLQHQRTQEIAGGGPGSAPFQ